MVLEKNSDKEVKKVKSSLLKHKIKSNIFKIKFDNSGNFHSEARVKRYDKIIEFCKEKKLKKFY